MKKNLLSLLLVATTLTATGTLNSCDRVKDAIEDTAIPLPFDIPLSFGAEIPFATVPTTDFLRYPEINMDVNLDAKIKEKYPRLSINNVKSAKLQTLSIDLVSSVLGGDLTAVKNAKIYIKTPNLPEKLVATSTNNTSGSKIVFTPNDEELINYLSSAQNSLILEIQGAKITLDKFNIKVNPSFRISVGL